MPEAPPRRAFQGPDLDPVQLSAQLLDPVTFLTRQETALADVVRDEGRPDRPVPVTGGDECLGAMDPIPRRLEVHSGVASELQPDLTSPDKGAVGQQSSQLREQRRERQVGSRGKLSRPQRLGDLVSTSHSIAIDGEIREQEASLPARQLLLDSPTGHSGNKGPAELNPGSAWL